MHVIILHLMNFAFLPLCQVLIFFFKVLDDFSIIDLFGALFVDLLLCHPFDLEHYFVEAVLVNQTESESLTLMEKEVHINIAKDFLLKSINQLSFDIIR